MSIARLVCFGLGIPLLLGAACLAPAAAPPVPARPIDPLPPGAIARVGTSRFRQTTAVSCVAFSPCGRWIASAGMDGTVRLWDASAGSVSWDRWVGVTTNIGCNAITFSPDGRHVAAAFPWAVSVYETRGGKFLHHLRPITEDDRGWPHTELCAATFSLDGKRVVAHDNRRLHVWELANGKARPDLAKKGEGLQRVTALPNARLLVRPRDEARWLAAWGKLPKAMRDHHRPPSPLALSEDGRYLVTDGGEGADVWAAGSGRKVLHLPGQDYRVVDAAFSPDGRTLATTSINAIRLWDVNTGRERFPAAGHHGAIIQVSLSHDGQTLLSANDRSAQVRKQARLTWTAKGWYSAHGQLALSADGEHLSVWMDRQGKIVDLRTGQDIWAWRPRPDRNQLDARFSPDGRTAIAWIAPYKWLGTGLCVIDPLSGRQLRELPITFRDFPVTLDPRVVVSANSEVVAYLDAAYVDAASIQVRDLRTGKVRLDLPLEEMQSRWQQGLLSHSPPTVGSWPPKRDFPTAA